MQNGATCGFHHESLKPADGRCANCGSNSHSKPDCPCPKSSQEKPTKPCAHGPKASRDDNSDTEETYGQMITTLVGQNQPGQPNDSVMEICRAPGHNIPEGVGVKGCSVPKGAGVHIHGATRAPRTTRNVEGSEQLVLVDSGANMELQPFPKSWNGVPPAGAQRITLLLAVGEGTAWELDGITYGKDLEPLMPWGKYSRTWKLSGDFNYDSKSPHIKHNPSGLTVPIVWVSNMPHISKETWRTCGLQPN